MKRIILTTALFTMLATACTTTVDETPEQPEAESEQLAEPGRMEPEKIQSAMRGQYIGEAKACYEALLDVDATAAGKVVLRFEIVDGKAEATTVEPTEGNLDDADFETCMHDALAEVSFPVVSGRVTVSYPVAFSDE